MTPLTIALLLATVTIAAANEIPEYIHVCAKNNPDMFGCLRESIDNLRPYLATGIPEIKVPSLEPLYLEELVAVQGKGIRISAKDIKAYGTSDFVLTNITLDHDNLIVDADVSHPHLFIDGTYYMEGKILLLPLSGSGPIRANLTDCKTNIYLKGVLKQNEQGQDYLYCTEFVVKSVIGKGVVQLGNLFGGDRVLGDVVNSSINNNFDVFFKEIGPLIEKALAEALRKIANNIGKSYTYAQLFPEN